MAIISSKEKDGTVNVLLCGKVSQEPKMNKAGNRVKFSVAYGKSKFMTCEVWADSDAGALAGCLEKGDSVFVAGMWREWTYEGKAYSAVTGDFLSVQQGAASQSGITEIPPMPVQKAEEAGNSGWQEINDDDSDLPF